MIGAISKKIFGSRNDRILSKYQKIVNKINALEADYEALSDEELTAKTAHFKQQVSDGTSLDEILVDAFATVREASKRVMDMRHYDVQLIGGMALHDGRISEMRTGEGKTLVATLAVYLNALANKGVHVITVNDYLAQRDADLMSKLYNFLGLSTGVIVSQMDHEARQQAYNCDITYGTNNEFGFDYLRDNMAFNLEDRVQRPLNFAIIDEVDSILIDEARTPLIISGPAENTSELYQAIDAVIPALKQQAREENEKEAPLTDEERGDFTVDEKSKQVHLTEDGQLNAEKALLQAGVLKMGTGLYDSNNINILHHLNAALRAHSLFRKDVDYIIANDDIVIVDEFTGRTMPGRRWSEGLHQAIEAKEGVKINPENQTMASITFQNFFRLYDKLSGMTGTADTEAFEFHEIYGLEVVVIPTNKDMIRIDANDLVYMTQEEKYHAIIDEIKYCQEKQQPVLVGTASIESSEILADLLKKTKIKYSVLNAKHHEQEAHIIENAGAPGAVTIATNMAGRGTDIMLGGSLEAELEALGDKASDAAIEKAKAAWQERHQQVKASGGLHIIGTERHESRRVDNQLRGRAGRQGDPGSSRFFLSLEDGLMRIFASERVKAIMQRLGMEKGQAIEAKLVNRSIENAQRKVESHNFDIRKNLLEYDDVANEQRKVIYQQRNETLEDDDLSDMIEDLSADVVEQTINEFIPPNSIDEMWNIAGLEQKLKSQYSIDVPVQQWLDDEKDLDESELRERLHGHVDAQIKFIEMQVGSENMRKIESEVLLFTLDSKWKEHLAAMDYLRQSVGLRGYAQKNPKQEYKREAFELFEGMLGDVKSDVITLLCNLNIQSPEAIEAAEMERQSEQLENLNYAHADVDTALSGENMQANAPFGDEGQRIGRNDPCPCGSGKKFKRCHGAIS